MKTIEGWREARLPLEKYLNIGDEVDSDLVWLQINALPPEYYDGQNFQMGEPYSHRVDESGRVCPTFYTFSKNQCGIWIFMGFHFLGEF